MLSIFNINGGIDFWCVGQEKPSELLITSTEYIQADEKEFQHIAKLFHSRDYTIPMPAYPRKRGAWYGDIAKTILANLGD